jgi:integrase
VCFVVKQAKRTAKHQLVKVATNLYRNGHGVYFAWLFRRNKQVKRSLKTRDLVTANQKLAKLQAKIEKLKDARKVLFQDLASRWLDVVKADQKSGSWARRNSAVNSLNRFFKGQWLRAISLEMVENWKIKRSGETTGRGKKVSSRTLNIELETLNLILGYAAKHGYLLENPAVGIQKNKVLKRQVTPPTKKQFAQLVTELRRLSATAKAADFVEFLGYSGLRLDEANEVIWADVEWTRGRIYVTGGSQGPKNMEEKRIPLFKPLRELLERMRAKVPNAIASELLFPRRNVGSAVQDQNKRPAGYNCDGAIKSACKRAGLPMFSHHDFRHFFCSNCVEAGIDFATIGSWLRHKDGGKLAAGTYSHLRADHTDKLAAKLDYTASVAEIAGTPAAVSRSEVAEALLDWLAGQNATEMAKTLQRINNSCAPAFS